MNKACCECGKDLSKWKQLDFTREIVCDDCTDGAVNFVATLEKESKEDLKRFRADTTVRGSSLGTIRNKEEYAVAYGAYKQNTDEEDECRG